LRYARHRSGSAMGSSPTSATRARRRPVRMHESQVHPMIWRAFTFHGG
jgi:hypothetical protein